MCWTSWFTGISRLKSNIAVPEPKGQVPIINTYPLREYDPDALRRYYADPLYLRIREKVRRILVLTRVSQLGDLIISTPLFRNLKRAFPDAKVFHLGTVPDYMKNLYQCVEGIDRNIPYHHLDDHRKPLGFYLSRLPIWWCFERESFRRFDLIIDTQRYFVSSFLTYLLFPKWMISAGSKSLFSKVRVPEMERRSCHSAVQTLALLQVMGIPLDHCLPHIPIPESYAAIADEILPRDGAPVITILPGSGIRFKCWDQEKFVFLTRILAERGFRILLLGGPDEKDLLASIHEQVLSSLCPGLKSEKVLSDPLIGAALLAKSALAIGNDNGGMHLASAIGTPIVAIFGPTSPTKFAPMAKEGRILYFGVACSPCNLRDCPYDKMCLTRIEVDSVLKAADDLLSLKALDS